MNKKIIAIIVSITILIGISALLIWQFSVKEKFSIDPDIQGNLTKISFFLVSFSDDNPVADYIAVEVKADKILNKTEEKIEYALKALFDLDDYIHQETGLINLLHSSDLAVQDIVLANETIIINLQGDLMGIGSMADSWIQGQIIKTIEQYTDNFVIKLNGSEEEWRCALDVTGFCKEQSFCQEQGKAEIFRLDINFLSNSEKETLIGCGEESWEEGYSDNFIDTDMYISVLSKNEKIWHLNTREASTNMIIPQFKTISLPEITDIDGDGIDEIIFSGRNWGGTCTFGVDHIFIYSPRYNQFFIVEKGKRSDIHCIAIPFGPDFSENLEKKEFQPFKDFLKTKIDEIET